MSTDFQQSFTLVTLIPSLSCITTFFFSCIMFDILSKLFPHCVIQDTQETPQKIREMKLISIRNLFIGFCIMICLHPLSQHILTTTNLSVVNELKVFVLIILLADADFYWSHRLLHHPAFYASCHKLHHSCKHPVSWTSLYVDFGEFVIAILSSFLLPLWTVALFGFKCHYLTYSAYLILLTFSLILAHDGMRIPFFDASHHDLHHLKFTGNYGTKFLMWDWLGRTLNH